MSYISDVGKLICASEAEESPEVILIDNYNGCKLRCSISYHKDMRKHRRIQRMDLELYKEIL